MSARQLLQARPGHEPLMHGLGSALNGKLEAMIVGPSQLVQLYDLVKGSGLPDAMKNPMLRILDEKSMGKASGPCKVTAVPQQVDWINHYLTAGEHEKLGQCSPYEGAHVVCKRLRLMGVKSLKESSKKVVTALLISCELARGGARPSHESIYLLSQHVGHCFLTCATAAPPGAAALQCYPADPFQLPEAHLQASYGTDKPVAKAYPEMANLVQYHVPVRSTSAKVRGAKVEAQQNQATKKQEALPMATAAPQLWQVAAQDMLQGMLASSMQQSKDVLNGGTCNLQFLTKSTGSLPLVPSRRSVLDDQEMPAKQEHAPAVPEDKQPGASAEPEDKAEEAPKEEKSLEDWEMTAFQSIQAKKQRKKGEPPSSQNKKVGKNKSLMKRPAAVMKRPAARVPTAGSSAAGPPSASGSWGCIRCRGNVNGCKACRKPGFSGRKFYSRGEWKEWAAANGKK